MDSKLIQLNHAIKQSGKRKITRDDIKQQAKRKGLWGRGRERQMNRERETDSQRGCLDPGVTDEGGLKG